MLLNPSHKITFSGLPPDVLDAYVRYKKGSRALVAWLIQYSPTPNRRVKTLPIKELEALAKTAAKSLRAVPDMVHFYFRETITSRKRLSKYFRAQVDESAVDVDTINHEHFTTSLAQIYNDLCACCGRNDHKSGSQKRESVASSLESPKNTYLGLDVEHIDEPEEESEQDALSSCPECTAAGPTSCEGKSPEVHFGDDELGTFLEVNEAIQRISDISSSVERCWALAANGHLSFPVAAFVTDVAFSMLRQVGVELLTHDEDLTLSRLHQLCCKRIGDEVTNGENSGDGGHVLLDELQKMEQSLLHFREGHSKLLIQSCAVCVQKPAEYIQPPAGGSGTTARPRFVEAIVDNIVHLVARTAAPPNIVRNSTPVYADVGYLITRDDEKAQSWSAILGLELLTKGYRSYLESLPLANEISRCRLAALRLAQQASSQVSRVLNDKTCFPCRCTQTLAYHLQNLEADLNSYAKYKCWDIYFQSPWVAGNQILEILDLCHYYGMRLFNYRHYVGAVLHSYNALTQLDRLKKIPILESLCDQFGGVFFPGGTRPKGSFRACWSRHVGARLKFKKGHKNRNSNDAWCMAIPAHAARRAAGLGAYGGSGDTDSTSKVDCLVFRVKQQDYNVGDDVWDSLNVAAADVVDKKGCATTRTTKRRSVGATVSSQRRRESLSMSTESSQQPRLLDLAEAAQRSFTTATTESGVLPLARLNMFAVFERCVQVVSTLSDGTHTSPDEKGSNCICFASAILTGGDRIVDARKFGRFETWKKDEKECVIQAGKAILDAFGTVKGDDDDSKNKDDGEEWLWSI
ncbi:hypothetical protein LTS17_003944 [Exophiala oligosperma]